MESHENHFRVVFLGHAPTTDHPAMIANLALMFKMTEDKVTRMFIDPPVAIKQGLSRQVAEAYVHSLEKAGARCRVEAEEVAPASNGNSRKAVFFPKGVYGIYAGGLELGVYFV